jgi:hypothetical protein
MSEDRTRRAQVTEGPVRLQTWDKGVRFVPIVTGVGCLP